MEATLLGETSDIVAAESENFPQSCSISPDGLCVLTSTNADAKIRLYNIHSPSDDHDDCKSDDKPLALKSDLICQGRDVVRSMDWYPAMNSSTPATCCFLVSCRGQPAHLWDAFTGQIRATYRPYNNLDELESPTVVKFSPSGQHIVAAGMRTDRAMHVFDTARPGRDSNVLRLGKTRRSSDGQKGLVSCVTFYDNENSLVVGTVSPASIYVYDWRMGNLPAQTILQGQCVVGHGMKHAKKKRHLAQFLDKNNYEDTCGGGGGDTNNKNDNNWLSGAKVAWYQQKSRGGIMHLQSSRHSPYLFSNSRQSSVVIQWDLRMLQGVASFANDFQTNQRIGFDLDDENNRLFCGGRNDLVRCYDVKSGDLVGEINVKSTKGPLSTSDTKVAAANDVSVDPKRSILAVSSGSRHFPTESELDCESGVPYDSSHGVLQLYKVEQKASVG